MKNTRLSTVFIAASAASLLMVSATSFAGHRAHRMSGDMNYKGENFKAEVPAPCPPVMLLRDGFYVGLGAGYDAYKIENNSSTTDAVGLATLYHSDHALTGWVGEIFVGYGRYFDTFYLGAEIGAELSAAKSSLSVTTPVLTDPDNLSIQLKARTSYTVALLPGIKVNDSTLLYIRGGYISTQFKASATFVDPVTGAAVSGSGDKWKNGYNYGVGIETYIAENISARGEYTHAQYNSLSSTAVNAAGVVVGSTSLHPSNNEFVLSLIYHA